MSKKLRRRLSLGVLLVSIAFLVDTLITIHVARQYLESFNTIDTFTDTFWESLKDSDGIHITGPSTKILLVGLSYDQLLRKPKTPSDYKPTHVTIYNLNHLTGSGGYLLEWTQDRVSRSFWLRRRYLSVRVGRQEQLLWGVGNFDGSLFLTNYPVTNEQLRESFRRPIARFERLYVINVGFNPQTSRLTWGIFDGKAVFQRHDYSADGYLTRSVALFATRSDAEKATLHVERPDGWLWQIGGRKVHEVSVKKASP